MNKTIYEMISDVKKGLNGSSIDLVCNYYDGSVYITDAISEQADSLIDIYYDDLVEWARDGVDYINRAISEFGANDFWDIIRQGQYLCYTDEMYDDYRSICELSALLTLRDEMKNGLELTDDQIELIMDDILDDYDRFDQIADDLKEAIENVTGSDDE